MRFRSEAVGGGSGGEADRHHQLRARVQHLDAARTRELFLELEAFGVRHDDPDMRNVTYRQSDGRFCIVDFEFATILPGTG